MESAEVAELGVEQPAAGAAGGARLDVELPAEGAAAAAGGVELDLEQSAEGVE